jgi:hypothetical protein
MVHGSREELSAGARIRGAERPEILVFEKIFDKLRLRLSAGHKIA